MKKEKEKKERKKEKNEDNLEKWRTIDAKWRKKENFAQKIKQKQRNEEKNTWICLETNSLPSIKYQNPGILRTFSHIFIHISTNLYAYLNYE